MSKLGETKLGEDLANDIKIINGQVSFLKMLDDQHPQHENSLAIAELLKAKASLLNFLFRSK